MRIEKLDEFITLKRNKNKIYASTPASSSAEELCKADTFYTFQVIKQNNDIILKRMTLDPQYCIAALVTETLHTIKDILNGDTSHEGETLQVKKYTIGRRFDMEQNVRLLINAVKNGTVISRYSGGDDDGSLFIAYDDVLDNNYSIPYSYIMEVDFSDLHSLNTFGGSKAWVIAKFIAWVLTASGEYSIACRNELNNFYDKFPELIGEDSKVKMEAFIKNYGYISKTADEIIYKDMFFKTYLEDALLHKMTNGTYYATMAGSVLDSLIR